MLPSQKRVALTGFLVALWRGVEVDAFTVPVHRNTHITRPSTSVPAAAGEASATAVESSSSSSAEGQGQGQSEDLDLPQALIFDCDGVLADTERDGHRPAFNAAFKIKNLGKWRTHDDVTSSVARVCTRYQKCLPRAHQP